MSDECKPATLTSLTPGRPGTQVLVHGTVRNLDRQLNLVEVQFEGYSLWISAKDIVVWAI